MSYVKRMVCLASSWKHAGRCIAGKEVSAAGFGGWVRPVSARSTQEISDEERECAAGGSAGPFDVVEIPFLRPVPRLHQTENHLIDPSAKWVKVGTLPVTEIPRLVDSPEDLWPDGSSSSHGLNDRVPIGMAGALRGSLALIEPVALRLLVQDEGGTGEARARVRADFYYRSVPYIVAVTDPAVMRAFRRKPAGHYPLADSWLCVSLGAAYADGYCYKLAAAVIAKPD